MKWPEEGKLYGARDGLRSPGQFTLERNHLSLKPMPYGQANTQSGQIIIQPRIKGSW